jgi:hypothetical protein
LAEDLSRLVAITAAAITEVTGETSRFDGGQGSAHRVPERAGQT